MYDGNLDDVTATRAWVDARKLPLVPALDAALGAEYLAASSDKLVVLLVADPADPTTAELMCVCCCRTARCKRGSGSPDYGRDGVARTPGVQGGDAVGGPCSHGRSRRATLRPS